jgi:hypothetical protein
MFDSWTGLRNALAGINGSTGSYWYSFNAASVLDTIVLPEDGQGLADPYLCLPMLEESEVFSETDQHGIRAVSNHTIFGFIRDTKDNPVETETVKLVARLRDDILRLILTDNTLGGTVFECRPVSAVYVAGLGGVQYGELQLSVEITQVVDLNDIGSAA